MIWVVVGFTNLDRAFEPSAGAIKVKCFRRSHRPITRSYILFQRDVAIEMIFRAYLIGKVLYPWFQYEVHVWPRLSLVVLVVKDARKALVELLSSDRSTGNDIGAHHWWPIWRSTISTSSGLVDNTTR